MPISATSSIHWRWNETDTSQFGSQINLGPVTGTVTLVAKPATGSFMVNPTIRVSLSTGFHTPSGSLALIPIDIDEIPKNIRVRFYVNNFSASNNITSNESRSRRLRWGVVLNCSSGSTNSEFNGTFWPVAFVKDVYLQPMPINAGRVALPSVATLAYRGGMVSSSYCLHDWYIKHLSMTGSSISGTDVESWNSCIFDVLKDNNSYTYTFNKLSVGYNDVHWSGSAFAGQVLNKAFLGFYYDMDTAVDTYSAVTGAFVEFDSFQLMKHPAGTGSEYQPPPLTMSYYSGAQQPPVLTSLSYWTTPTGTLTTITSGRIRTLRKFSGTVHTFGAGAATAPHTSSQTLNLVSYPTAFFTGGFYLTSSTTHAGYISGTGFRNYYVFNVLTATLNNASRYTNHIIHADTSGWWGVYFRDNANGSGTIDCYAWGGAEVTASFEFKYNSPILLEYWTDTTKIYAKINNSLTISSSVGGTDTIINGSPSQLGDSNNGCRWHLFEMITSTSNTSEDSNTVGVGNYLANKYGFSTSSLYTSVGGENW